MKWELLLNLLTVSRQVRWVLLFLLSFVRSMACANHILQSLLFKRIFSANYLSMDSKTFLRVTSDFCKLSPSLKVKNICKLAKKWVKNNKWSRRHWRELRGTIPEYNSNTSITNFIKNWIIGWWNSTALIGLAIMVYEPLFHALWNNVTLVIKHDKACQLRGRYWLKRSSYLFDSNDTVVCKSSCVLLIFSISSFSGAISCLRSSLISLS